MLINGKRALAYIVTCGKVSPIPGADNIDLAEVGGWKVIVKKGEIKEGDRGVFFEIDSKLPEAEWSEFLRPKHFKVKTMKLGKFGVISQGLLLPLSLFPELADAETGTDVTDALGVRYAAEEDNFRKRRSSAADEVKRKHPKFFKNPFIRRIMRRKWGRKLMLSLFGWKKVRKEFFPSDFPFVSKTDEERVENIPQALGYKNPLVVTEKLDGTSSTYLLERKGRKKFEFYVCSRNVRLFSPDQKTYHSGNIYWEMAVKYGIEDKLRKYLAANPKLKYVCIQGESVGSVQGNPLKLRENDLYIFNFIRSDTGRLPSLEGKAIVESWGMKWVPVLDTAYYVPDDMETFKQYATAKSVVNPAVLREGVVLRDPTNGFSFKNVSREYLLKHGG